MTVIDVEVTIDTICPYCYIGKKNLDKAMAEHLEKNPDDEFEVVYKPFYLNPSLKGSGITKDQLYKFKFGRNVQAFYDRIAAAGAAHSITFDFSGRAGSSRDSHKLILLAGRQAGAESQARAVDLLYEGSLERGADISDLDFLLDVAERLGLDPEETRRWLREPGVGDEVDRLVRGAVARQITAVPTVQVQGRYRVGGLQEPDVFLKVFDKVHAQ